VYLVSLFLCVKASKRHLSSTDRCINEPTPRHIPTQSMDPTQNTVDKRVNLKLVTSWHSNGRRPGAENYIARPNFKNCIFNKNCIAIQMNKEYVLYDKPLYVGFKILDLSKTIIYDVFLHFLET
jgi:hypothetical protein